MAIYEYGTFNISFDSFITWSNNETSLSNLDILGAYSDMYPSISSNLDINNTIRFPVKIFYGNIVAGTNGTVGITAPYTVSQTSGTIKVKNVILSSYNITISAVATYPYVFSAWRTSASGGGSVISTSNTLTISIANNNGSHLNYYAYFVAG
jgi:hypothetical protein